MSLPNQNSVIVAPPRRSLAARTGSDDNTRELSGELVYRSIQEVERKTVRTDVLERPAPMAVRPSSAGGQSSPGTPNHHSQHQAQEKTTDKRSVDGNTITGNAVQRNWNFVVQTERHTEAHIKNNKAGDDSKQDNIVMNDPKTIEAFFKSQKFD